MTKYATQEWKEKIIEAANTELTMSKAAISIGMPFNSFKRWAEKYEVYQPNQGGKGTSKPNPSRKLPLEEILLGKHPQYNSHKLRLRLIKENIFKYKCNCCELTTWLDGPIPLELEHKDGNPRNHKLENLELLCPNCHALTDTYRGKNIRNQPLSSRPA